MSSVVTIGRSTIIPVFSGGRLSHLPLGWWLMRWNMGAILTIDGTEPLQAVCRETQHARRIISQSVDYPDAIDSTIVHPNTVFIRPDGHPFPLSEFRSKVKQPLLAERGWYVVSSVRNVQEELWEVNVKTVGYLEVMSESD